MADEAGPDNEEQASAPGSSLGFALIGAGLGLLLGLAITAWRCVYVPGVNKPELLLILGCGLLGAAVCVLVPQFLFGLFEGCANFAAGFLRGELFDRYWPFWDATEIKPGKNAPTWAVILFCLGFACAVTFCHRHGISRW